MTKPVDLESLEAKYGKATPGEWLDGETVVCVTPGEGREGIIADLYCDTMGHAQPEREANTALIVALVNAFPAMAAELRALREVRDAAKASMVCQCNGGSGCPWSRLHVALAALSETP
jgi:hypothetical protein